MPRFEVTGQDGKRYEVEAPDAQAAFGAFKKFQSAAPAAGGAASMPAPERFTDPMAAGLGQGFTLGWGDELYSGATAPLRALPGLFNGEGYDLGKAYQSGLDMTRDTNRRSAEANPLLYNVGEVGGALSLGGAAQKGGLTLLNAAKPTVASLGGRGAAEGAIYGGLSGAGRSEGASLSDRLQEGVAGAVEGGLVGGALGGIGGALGGRQVSKLAPSVDDLKARASGLYDAAAARGATIPKTEVQRLANDIAAKAISEGLDPTLHPRATAALKRLVDASATGLTTKDAQTLRRVLASAARDPMNPDEGRIVGQMLDEFDSTIGKVAPELDEARAVYHQAKKGELIEQTIELAGSRAGQFSGSGFENALRTEFRNLERQIIKGQLKGLTDEEIAAIKKVAHGGPVENITRFIGKFAPTGAVNFMAAGGVPFAVGSAVGGPGLGALLAGGTMGAGLAGRGVATSLGITNAKLASALVRSGGKSLPKNAVSGGTKALAQALISGGSGQAPRLTPWAMPTLPTGR